ncbi:sugar kinase, partial [Streptomyces sp. SID6013]|nr:sugar kinase [Streptomyces sp. SID6013]
MTGARPGSDGDDDTSLRTRGNGPDTEPPAASPWRPGRGPVVCLGETMAAMAPAPPHTLDGAESLRLSVAGAESNVAMYLADLGLPVSWLS